MKIIYPGKLACRTIANEAACAVPSEVEIVVPTIVKAGEPFTAKIALTDSDGIPAADFSGEIVLRQPECDISINIAFFAVISALAEVRDILIASTGIYRFEVEFKGRVFFSNPCVCRAENRQRIFWGDPHIHTVLSNCHTQRCRSLNFCFNAARYLSCLDWAGAADHVSNQRCELARWKEQAAAANAYDDPPDFVTLPAYEASLQGGSGGDNNVYMNKFPSIFIDEYDGGNVKSLCEKLTELARKDEFLFFVVPHHTTRTVKHGEIPDEIYPGENLMPVMEIHSKWGTSEYRDNPTPLKKIHPGPGYAVDMLNRGLRLGFIGGTDSHATMTFVRGEHEPPHIDRLPGLTAVITEKLGRTEVFQAISRRSCYAASGERVYLDFKVNGVAMGQSIESTDITGRSIFVECAGKSDIDSIEIVRNGLVIKQFNFDNWYAELTFEDNDSVDELWLDTRYGKIIYYYVRIRCRSGASAWASPVWFSKTHKN